MKTVLVTGGAGFIGSNLTRRLLNEGYLVVAFDNFSTGSERNIQEFKNNENYAFVKGDILRKEDLSVLDEYSFDIIFNMACPANPPYCFSHSIDIIKINTIGIFNLEEIALKNNAVFVQSSTSEVYGNPKENPQDENYWGNVNPCGIRSCYDEGKRCAEAFLFDCIRYYNLDVRIIRIFNTYGPNMVPNDGRCIVQFFSAALKNDDIKIFGDGKQTRSFCYIDDLIEAIIRLVNLKEAPDIPINIGNPNEITILELAEKIIKCCNSNSKIVFLDPTQDDPQVRCPKIERAKNILNWIPTVPLEDGLKKSKQYFERVFK